MPNVGGFLYSMRDVDPNYVAKVDTTEKSIPEETEHDALANTDAPAVINSKNARSIWFWLAAILGLFILFNIK
jgi:hypothetical protein